MANIHSGVDLSQLAAHIRNSRRASPAINSSFANIEFVIDGPEELPYPGQLLNITMPSQGSSASMNSLLSAGNRDIPSLGNIFDHGSNAG